MNAVVALALIELTPFLLAAVGVVYLSRLGRDEPPRPLPGTVATLPGEGPTCPIPWTGWGFIAGYGAGPVAVQWWLPGGGA